MDLNADLGEGGTSDAQLMQCITSCSIACGGHFGTLDTITNALALAEINNVAVGAHPSFPDPEHFGRRMMRLEKEEFQDMLFTQLNSFSDALKQVDLEWQHIKAHGALYHAIAYDATLAEYFFEVVRAFPEVKGVFLPALHSVSEVVEKYGIHVWVEGFADRAYQPDGRLVAREAPHAVLEATKDVLDQVKKWEAGKAIPFPDATKVSFCDTICIHSDTPNALEHAQALNARFNFTPLK